MNEQPTCNPEQLPLFKPAWKDYQTPQPKLMWDAKQFADAIWPDRPANTPMQEIIDRANTHRLVWETAHLKEWLTE